MNKRNIKKKQVALLLSIFAMVIRVSTAGFVVAEREGPSEQYAGAHLESVFPLYVRLSPYVYSGVVRDITRFV